MCEAVQQLGEHFEGRIEAIGKCRELVGDHPEEREEVSIAGNPKANIYFVMFRCCCC